jgi:pimeloyl-ACP methyl ester carboxylesterase
MTKLAGGARSADYSTSRLNQRYRFADPNMDLFFLSAVGWGSTGGLSVGEAFHVANQIEDGDGDSWARAFEAQGVAQGSQADLWRKRGWMRAAGEARLKAFASYRMAWQFVAPGDRFVELIRTSQGLFDQAMRELGLPSTRFAIPYEGGELPGHFFEGGDPSAPTILLIGGADSGHENLFLSTGRHFIGRGYSVAMVDLPGQGLVQAQGLHWEIQAERSIAAVIDYLIDGFRVERRRLALLGTSLGGYFACRAAAHEPRVAAVVASTPVPRPGELFAQVARVEAEDAARGLMPSDVARKNRQVLLWKAGVADMAEMIARWDGVAADPARVTIPFLSVVGAQEGSVFQEQAKEWHEAIPSEHKSFVFLESESGADAHCQANNPLRLVQEADGWLSEVLRGA